MANKVRKISSRKEIKTRTNPCIGITKKRQNEIIEDLLLVVDENELKKNLKKYTDQEKDCALYLEQKDSEKFG